MRRVQFFRDFRRLTGGHLKVRHYFEHARRAPGFAAQIRFGAETAWTEDNPWLAEKDQLLAAAVDAPEPDILFVAGMDWEALLAPQHRAAAPLPVINLVQHVRHAEPAHPLSAFLSHKAIRICVSEEVRAALAATGRVNGPLLAIPNGLDIPLPAEDTTALERPVDVLLVAVKQPQFAGELEASLRCSLTAGAAGAAPVRLQVITERQPRQQFLAMLGACRVVVFTPNPTEGFYLPALEAMALGALTGCPDVVGNRTFCVPGVNSLRPAYSVPAMTDAVAQALRLTPEAAAGMRRNARHTAAAHSLLQERERFLQVLDRVDELWHGGAP